MPGRVRDDEFRSFTEPPGGPPGSLRAALATPLRDLAGCWIQSWCQGCRRHLNYSMRGMLTQRRERAEMPLRRAVGALRRCSACGSDRRLELVSDPNWKNSQRSGGSPNWSLVLTGRAAGAIGYTVRDRVPYRRPGCS